MTALIFGIIAIVVLAAGAWLFTIRPKSFQIHDTAQPHQFSYEKFTPFGLGASKMEVEIVGELDGTARIFLGNNADALETGKGYLIGPGRVLLEEEFVEWWSNRCLVRYAPVDVKSGNLRITISIH